MDNNELIIFNAIENKIQDFLKMEIPKDEDGKIKLAIKLFKDAEIIYENFNKYINEAIVYAVEIGDSLEGCADLIKKELSILSKESEIDSLINRRPHHDDTQVLNQLIHYIRINPNFYQDFCDKTSNPKTLTLQEWHDLLSLPGITISDAFKKVFVFSEKYHNQGKNSPVVYTNQNRSDDLYGYWYFHEENAKKQLGFSVSTSWREIIYYYQNTKEIEKARKQRISVLNQEIKRFEKEINNIGKRSAINVQLFEATLLYGNMYISTLRKLLTDSGIVYRILVNGNDYSYNEITDEQFTSIVLAENRSILESGASTTTYTNSLSGLNVSTSRHKSLMQKNANYIRMMNESVSKAVIEAMQKVEDAALAEWEKFEIILSLSDQVESKSIGLQRAKTAIRKYQETKKQVIDTIVLKGDKITTRKTSVAQLQIYRGGDARGIYNGYRAILEAKGSNAETMRFKTIKKTLGSLAVLSKKTDYNTVVKELLLLFSISEKDREKVYGKKTKVRKIVDEEASILEKRIQAVAKGKIN